MVRRRVHNSPRYHTGQLVSPATSSTTASTSHHHNTTLMAQRKHPHYFQGKLHKPNLDLDRGHRHVWNRPLPDTPGSDSDSDRVWKRDLLHCHRTDPGKLLRVPDPGCRRLGNRQLEWAVRNRDHYNATDFHILILLPHCRRRSCRTWGDRSFFASIAEAWTQPIEI